MKKEFAKAFLMVLGGFTIFSGVIVGIAFAMQAVPILGPIVVGLVLLGLLAFVAFMIADDKVNRDQRNSQF